jgi:hypothetical protein
MAGVAVGCRCDPLRVVVMGHASVQELIGLILSRYTDEGRQPALKVFANLLFDVKCVYFSLLVCLCLCVCVCSRIWRPMCCAWWRTTANLTWTCRRSTTTSPSASFLSTRTASAWCVLPASLGIGWGFLNFCVLLTGWFFVGGKKNPRFVDSDKGKLQTSNPNEEAGNFVRVYVRFFIRIHRLKWLN